MFPPSMPGVAVGQSSISNFEVATNFSPSAEEATHLHCFLAPVEVFSVQVPPESVDVQILPFQAQATNFSPFAEDATDLQSFLAPTESSSIQVTPESVDVQMLPPPGLWPAVIIATNFSPFAEEATAHHLFPVPLFEKVLVRPKLPVAGAEAAGDDAGADEDAAKAGETQGGGESAAATKKAPPTAQHNTCTGCSRCIRPEELCFRCPRENAHQTLDSQGTPAASAGTRRSGVDEAVYCMECDVFIHDVLHNTPPPLSASMIRQLEAATQRAAEERPLVKREREEQD